MSFWPASSQIVVCFVLFILPGPSLIMGIAEAEAELRIMRAKVALFFLASSLPFSDCSLFSCQLPVLQQDRYETNEL